MAWTHDRMNWDAIGAIGEIIGAAGVIGTLLYLAIQVRASTAATETENRSAIANGYRAILTLNFDSEIAHAFRVGIHDYPNMTFDGRVKFANLCGHEFLLFQTAFAQYEAGQLDTETYESYLSWLASIIVTPGGSNWWEETRPVYLSRMVKVVDRRIADGGLNDIRKMPQFECPDGDI